MFQEYEYKGHRVQTPEVQLRRAKKLLADGGAGRTYDWEAKSSQLAEYLDFLQQNYNGEGWGDLLQEVIGMLQAHRIHENYTGALSTSGLGSSGPAIPKKSTRLPPVSGASTTKRPGGYKHPRPSDNKARRLSAQDHDSGSPDNRDPMAYTKGCAFFRNQGVYRDIGEDAAHLDLVNAVEPGKEWPEWMDVDARGRAATELVRQGLVREAYNNQTTLWPRRSGVSDSGGDGNGTVMPSRGREDVWAFGHPSVRPKAKRFFDMKRWPVIREIEEETRESGPEQQEGAIVESVEELLENEGEGEGEGESEREVVRSFADDGRCQEFWVRGDSFLLGNTPRHQKAIINRLRRSEFMSLARG